MATTKVRKSEMSGLNDKQRLFVCEYLTDLNGTRAATVARYKFPQKAAIRLLAMPAIKKIVARTQRENLEQSTYSREEIIQRLTCLAFRDVIDLADPATGQIIVSDLRQLPKRVRACVDGIKCRSHEDKDGNVTQEIELKLAGIMPALELLMRHFGMLDDRLNLTASAQSFPPEFFDRLSGVIVSEPAYTDDHLTKAGLSPAQKAIAMTGLLPNLLTKIESERAASNGHATNGKPPEYKIDELLELEDDDEET